MHRRQYLALSSTALLAAVAGCGSDDGDDGDGTPVDDGDDSGDGDPTPVEPTETPTPTPVDENLQSYGERLESEGVEVLDLVIDDGIVSLDYASSAETDDEIVEEAGPIARTFGEELQAGWDAAWLEVWLLDDGEETASYFVNADWVRDWRDGELSDEEFFDRVREEIQHE